MTFQEIFDEDGLYSSNYFVDGFCFRIEHNAISGVQYKNKTDLMPTRHTHPVYKSLFKLDYFRVLNIGQLFNKKKQ